MKKKKGKLNYILFGLCIIILIVILGCLVFFKVRTVKDNSSVMLTEKYLNKYNELSEDVVSKIDYSFITDLNKEQKETFKQIMKKQYKKMHYSIVDKNIKNKRGSIIAEVTVFDYNTCLNNATDYISLHSSNYSSLKLANEYKLKSLNTCSYKQTYEITFKYMKIDKKWIMEDLSDSDLRKLNGTF